MRAIIISLWHTLGMTANAEGVKTPAQAALLRAEEREEVQDLHFGRPMPPAQVTALLEGGAASRLAPRLRLS